MRVCYDKTSPQALVTDCPPGTLQLKVPLKCSCCGQLLPGSGGSPRWLKVKAKRLAPEMTTLPARFVRQYIKYAVRKLPRKTGTLVATILPVTRSPKGQKLVRFGLWHVKAGADSGFEKGTEPDKDWWDPPSDLCRYLPKRV